MKEHDNIMDKNNQREIVEFERSFLIGTQDNTYDYNAKFWYLVRNIFIHSYVILMYLIVMFNVYWNYQLSN